ncbi:MAG: hypothetical protein A2254_02545 [Ignavibacteria bacterium RIFOXYA2_FULL_35_9]|nr:MAG: hypothetical protein A2X60_16045 [Ignavibacteria bacterium GWF2_35_20]OGU79382.1 MAG: hypothetical protein A2254_02545 [Ignavibacteria bacterium RIFOXYA2_FULL_35_9]
MSVYNGELFLRDSIKSILNQTFRDFEYIIVNDGSIDSSEQIIKNFNDTRIVYLKQTNKGLSEALNEGINYSSGKYIARMDDDDIAKPNRLAVQLRFMENNTNYVTVGSTADFIDEDGTFLYSSKSSLTPIQLKELLPESSPFIHSSVLMRTGNVRAVGGYHNVGPYFYQEDLLLWIDLAKTGEFYNIPEPLIKFRITSSSNQQRSKNYFSYQMTIVKEYYRTGKLDSEKIINIKPEWGSASNKVKKSNYYLKIGSIFLYQNYNKKTARRNLLKAIKSNIFNKKALAYLAFSFLPQICTDYIRKLSDSRK